MTPLLRIETWRIIEAGEMAFQETHVQKESVESYRVYFETNVLNEENLPASFGSYLRGIAQTSGIAHL